MMLGILLLGGTASAMRTRRPPVLTDLKDQNQLVELNNYLSEVYELTNGRYTLENLVTNPQDTRKGVKGDLVYATYSSIDHLCINTSFPAGKDWTCVNVETLSTCPGGDNKQVQYNRNGTCMGDLSFIFDEDRDSVGVGADVITPAATFEIDPIDTTISGEVVAFKSSSQTLTFASSGSTVANQRQNQFIAPTINGIAGGATETVTNTSTVYIDAPPSGSNITFTNGPWDQWLDCTVDGDCLNLLISNSQTNSAASTNETSQIRFGFGTDKDVSRFVVGKRSDYTSDNASDAFLAFYVDVDNVDTEVMRIANASASVPTVSIGTTSTAANNLNVKGNVAIGAIAGDGTGTGSAPTSGLLVQGKFQIGHEDGFTTPADMIVHIRSTAAGTSLHQNAGLLLEGPASFNIPSLIRLGNTTTQDQARVQLTSAGGATDRLGLMWIPDSLGYIGIENATRTVVGSEDPQLIGASQTMTLSSGTTITNQRQYQFLAPVINGVAGGATETVTNGATLYVDTAPSGSNITFTNGPYALWVDAGKTQLDGTLQLGQNGASGQLVLYAELGGTDYTTTINPSSSQSQNVTYTLPPDDGTASGILVTDGSGVLTWNNAGAVAAGQWTPTTNDIANLDSSSAAEGQYIRVGTSVSFSVQLTVNPTLTATSTQTELDLPVTSNFGATSDAAGSCAAPGIAGMSAAVTADAASNELEIRFVAGDITAQELDCVGVFQVI